MAQPTSPTENTLAVSLPGDVVSHVVSFLKLETLCALHATGTFPSKTKVPETFPALSRLV